MDGLDRGWVRVAGGVLFALSALGCAEGYGTPEGFGTNASPILPMWPDAGMTGAAGMEAPPEPMFMGEPCSMGQTAACTCADGVSQGTKLCIADAASPTGGAFGPCDSCVAPMPPPAAGMSGEAGMGGEPGGGEAGGGDDEPEPEPEPGGECNPRDCDEPAFGEACCTERGECGTRLFSISPCRS